MSQLPDAEWFHAHDGQQTGPHTLDALRDSLATGAIAPDALVWREGMADWSPARTVPELEVAIPATALLSYAVLQYHTAGVVYVGFWWRVLAAIIDGLIIGVPNFLIELAFGFVAENSGSRDAALAINIIASVLGYVIAWLYEACMVSSASRATFGKLACGFIVVDLNGQRLSFGRATGRHFAKYLSSLILCIGYIMVAFTEKKQGLHDIICNTLVIKKAN